MTRFEYTVTREEYRRGQRVKVAKQYTARQKRGPKAFPAKYQSLCAWCGYIIKRGEHIKASGEGRYMHHWCWCEADQAPKQG